MFSSAFAELIVWFISFNILMKNGISRSLSLFKFIFGRVWSYLPLMASLLQHMGFSLVVSRFSCPMAGGILVLQPGFQPVSPALEDRFLTTGPPGNSLSTSLASIIASFFSPLLIWF